jgi:hypothetical protein
MVYTTMTNFEIMFLNYVRELINNCDFRDNLGIMTMRNIDVSVTTKHYFDDANRNEEIFYDDDFSNSYWN